MNGFSDITPPLSESSGSVSHFWEWWLLGNPRLFGSFYCNLFYRLRSLKAFTEKGQTPN